MYLILPSQPVLLLAGQLVGVCVCVWIPHSPLMAHSPAGWVVSRWGVAYLILLVQPYIPVLILFPLPHCLLVVLHCPVMSLSTGASACF